MKVILHEIHHVKCTCTTPPEGSKLLYPTSTPCSDLRNALYKGFKKSKVRKAELRRMNRMLEFYGYKFREFIERTLPQAAAREALWKKRADRYEQQIANAGPLYSELGYDSRNDMGR